MTVAITLGADLEDDEIDVLIQDPHWVDLAFASIMKAAGFDERLVVGTTPSAPAGPVSPVAHLSGGRDRVSPPSGRPRVRSPPAL